VVLEALRIMASHNYSATVVFATFTAEEQGLYGSNYTAQQYATQKKNLVAVLNNDIVGGQIQSSETNLTDYTHLRVFSIFGPSGREMIHRNDNSHDILKIQVILILKQH